MLLLLALLFSFSYLRVAVADTCYYPDGSSVPNHFPCTSGNGTTMCCSIGEICLASGMCKAGPQFENPYYKTWPYVRGACTDASWQSSGCLKHCHGYNIGDVDSICGNDTNGYCCFEDALKATASSCVCSPGKAFMIRAGDAVTTITPSPSGPAVSSGTTKSASATSSSSVSSSPSSPWPAPSNTSVVPTTAPTEAPQQFNGSVKLGVGIGVPVGIAALAVVGFLLWRRRRRYRRDFEDRYRLSEMPQNEPKVHEVGNTQGYESLHELPNDDGKTNKVGSAQGREGLHEMPVDRELDSRAELEGHR